jgi:hypothetical protein
MAGKGKKTVPFNKDIAPFIVLTHAQADQVDSIDAFSDGLRDVFWAASSGYMSSDTHHVCEVEEYEKPVDADTLSIQYDPLRFEELKDLSAAEAFGFDPAPWAGKKNARVFVAKP